MHRYINTSMTEPLSVRSSLCGYIIVCTPNFYDIKQRKCNLKV